MSEAEARTRAGLLLGVGAYLSWGVMPLYFRLIASVPAAEIVAHRIIWSLLFLAALVAVRRGWGPVRAALERRSLAILIATAMLIAVNWLVFTWAVTHGHVLAASLGYYLNPLVNILLGVVLLKERLSRAQIVATALAAAGVAVLAFGAGAGTGLWISLSLAASFALYGFLRKIAPAGALEGLCGRDGADGAARSGLDRRDAGVGNGGLHRERTCRHDAGRARRRGHCDPAAAVHRRGTTAALFDARLPPIYRADAAVRRSASLMASR